LRAMRSNLVVNLFKHYGIASSLTLLAMTAKEDFFNNLLRSMKEELGKLECGIKILCKIHDEKCLPLRTQSTQRNILIY